MTDNELAFVNKLLAEIDRLRNELTWIATCTVVITPHTRILQQLAAKALEK